MRPCRSYGRRSPGPRYRRGSDIRRPYLAMKSAQGAMADRTEIAVDVRLPPRANERPLSSLTCIGELPALLPQDLDSALILLVGAFARAVVNSEAGCLLCSRPRLLKAAFPVAKGYELKLYECASCGSDLWLVTRVSELSTHKRHRGTAAAFAQSSPPLPTRSPRALRQSRKRQWAASWLERSNVPSCGPATARTRRS